MKNLKMMSKVFFSGLLLLLLILPLTAKDQPTGNQTQKKIITSIDQLPRHTYKISGTVTQLVTDEKAFADFSRQVRQDIEKDLQEYEIRDSSTLRSYHEALMILDMSQGNHEAVLKRIQGLRDLEEKPAAKLMTALFAEVITLTRQETETHRSQFQEAFSRILAGKIKKFPWQTVQESIIGAKGSLEMVSKNFFLGIIRGQFEPVAKKTGYISSDIALQVIRMHIYIKEVLPLKEQILKVYNDFISANRVVKPDIWKERQVDLTNKYGLSPVVVAIWDTGVDTSVFPQQLFTNPREKLDGKDNDENGFVDDVHGIAYTLDVDKTPALLYQVEDGSQQVSANIELMKGYVDLTTSVDSPEAAALKKKMAALQPKEIKALLENLMKQVLYIHGTHVSGIAIAGNPYARILVVRLSADYRQIPEPMTMELAHKMAKMLKEVIAYFKTHNVRVVNMSWDISVKEIERDLEANGIGKTPEERRKMAREMFDVQKKAFYEAIKNAPGIVFVNAAGNDDDDPTFQDCIPTAFDLPNVIVAGAVDQAGDETTFTSFGEAVDVYANGYNVESFLPGGQTMPASGTSMSSPQVANLAAKLLALAPQLEAKQVVELIKKGAEKSKDGRILLINPKRTVQLLNAE